MEEVISQEGELNWPFQKI